MLKHRCAACGSQDIRKDRRLGGRLVCNNCGSYAIGFARSLDSGSAFNPFSSDTRVFGFNVSPTDWQYLMPAALIIFVFIFSDLIPVFSKGDFAYWSGGLLLQPYRAITMHLFHASFGHLLSNIGGIIISRYFFLQLGLRSKSLFGLLVLLLMPLQAILKWFFDMFIASNPSSFAIGFSGIAFGIDAFILMASIYGKARFLGGELGLSSNLQVRQTCLVFTAIGVVYSLLPGVDFIGHLVGFLAGLLLFLF